MWHPEPGWQRLSGGGPSTVGLWRARVDGSEVVVKRLQRPADEDPAALWAPHHPAWWRREAEVALDGCVETTPGLRAAPVLRVEEDVEGITLVSQWVAPAHHAGLYLARALGAFAAAPLPDRSWMARDLLRSRMGHVAQRGGWQALRRTRLGPVADRLWRSRESHLAQLDALPRVSSHGDPVVANLRGGTPGEAVVALDWSTLGSGPVGSDLGYFSLSAREEFEPLLEAYLLGLGSHAASRAQVVLGARITAVHTALTRADWALSMIGDSSQSPQPRVASLRHPSMTPHVHSLQRQLAHLEALLD